MPDARLTDYRRRLAKRRKQNRFIVRRINILKAAIAKRKKALAKPKDPGAKAVRFLLDRVGWVESPAGSNDSRFLANWRRALPSLSWMKGQPWCGFACVAAYHYAAKKRLPDDTVSTIAIANRARSGDGYSAVSFNRAKAGDLVVFHFGSGGPKHVGLAIGPPSGGVVRCIEGNTSSTNAGSQSNGGGIFIRSRSRGLVHTVARPK